MNAILNYLNIYNNLKMRRLLISLLILCSSATVSQAETVDGYDIRDNIFYENYFWEDRKLTERELSEAYKFISYIGDEIKNGNSHAVGRLSRSNSRPSSYMTLEAELCDTAAAASTLYSIYKEQSKYYPKFKKYKEGLFKDLLLFKRGLHTGEPSLQECIVRNYWMPFVDVFDERSEKYKEFQ
ncbi:hypothetical protein [Acinetobacter defluvii]|uniref:hypothetical protein n=1 Tax=Acinetobacter defluvii TaxID=1871111 RepID=UPI003AF5528E